MTTSLERRRSISMNEPARHITRIPSTPKRWVLITCAVLLLHAAILLFFKPQYLEVFRAEPPRGEEGNDRYPFLNNPFHVLSLSVEPRSTSFTGARETAVKPESAEETESFETLGEPQSEMLPLQGRAGRSGGKTGPRSETVEPKPLYIPWPKYPQGVKQIPQGSVELMLLINEKGEVQDVKVTRELPLSELNRIAVDAAWKIRFTPGTEKGIRKSMWVRLAIGFQPR
jgi:TonB family protein